MKKVVPESFLQYHDAWTVERLDKQALQGRNHQLEKVGLYR